MSNRLIQRVLAAVALIIVGSCYQDDFSGVPRGQPLVRVSLTDAPFPYDSLGSVNVYVVRIEASTGQDTSGGGQWTLITEPRKSFDLLALQQGTTALLGEGELPAGQYHAIRVTIDTSLSSVVWNSTGEAHVNWNGNSVVYAFVEYPVNVPSEGADIIIDFDVGRSFLFDFYGTNEFDFNPQLRAINSAAAGAIAGTVTSDAGGTTSRVRNAQVSVFVPYPGKPDSTWYLEATGRSDDTGHYQVAFLPPGTYIVRIEEPFLPYLDPVVTPSVQVAAGDTTALSVLLPNAGSSGAYVRVSGPTSVGIGGTITLFAAVGDANGNPVPNPSVSWTSSDSSVARVTGTSDTAFVAGRQAGFATIYATSGGHSDSHTVQVIGPSMPVATVTVVPSSASLAVGDSVTFTAELRDSLGNVLYDRSVAWFSADSAVIYVYSSGAGSTFVRALAPGTAILRATSEGKAGQATITVH